MNDLDEPNVVKPKSFFEWLKEQPLFQSSLVGLKLKCSGMKIRIRGNLVGGVCVRDDIRM